MTTHAILARTVDYGEADRIGVLLTADYGKVSVICRGARQSRKRFGAALDHFVVGEATLRKPQRGTLLVLERFESVRNFSRSLVSDLTKWNYANYLIEAASELWPIEHAEPQLFDLIVEALAILSEHDAKSAVIRAYELKLLALLGVVPSFDRCVNCGVPAIEGSNAFRMFNHTLGGILCEACGHHGRPLEEALYRHCVSLQGTSFIDACQYDLPRDHEQRLHDFMTTLVERNAGKPLKTLNVMRQFSALSPSA